MESTTILYLQEYIKKEHFCFYSRYLERFAAIESYGWSLASVVHMLATWLVVLVTFHRYVAVCHPHKNKAIASIKSARLQALVIVVATAVFNVSRFFEAVHSWNEAGNKVADMSFLLMCQLSLINEQNCLL